MPLPLSEIQNGLVAKDEMPQGLIRSGSVALEIEYGFAPKGPAGPASTPPDTEPSKTAEQIDRNLLMAFSQFSKCAACPD